MRTEITPVFVETVPEELEDGVLYISLRYRTAAHKCACGCGMKVATPIHPTAWAMHWNGREVSLSPSIGNWQFPCRSHYLIRRNRIVQARDLANWEIERGRERDREKRSIWLRRQAQQVGGEEKKGAGAGSVLAGQGAAAVVSQKRGRAARARRARSPGMRRP